MAAVSAITALAAWCQPMPFPAGPNTPCDENPKTDTLDLPADGEGYRPLFDGASFKGWWESCKSGHSKGDTLGGLWVIDQANKAIASNQNPARGGIGSILMTNKQYANYELVMDLWLEFGNDAGIYNRTTPKGRCYQTVLDYLPRSALLGAYSEGGFPGNIDVRPFTFDSSKSIIKVTSDWVNLTKNGNFGCPATGCTAADWTRIWDVNGWNQVKVKVYGTGASVTNKLHVETYFRKVGAENWIPMLNDSRQLYTPAGHIGLQIHRDTERWAGRVGNYYRNIKIRLLDDKGVALPGQTSITNPRKESSKAFRLHAKSGSLVGFMGLDHEVLVRDMGGRIVERFAGKAGEVNYVFRGHSEGLLLVTVKSALGENHYRVSRVR
ncbi:MAG TPA: family 16 glycoside hydrolase [Fibrobacteria bacterium]|nr:family 16 glycoside hydrolase [Fibrobacteria bacterium]